MALNINWTEEARITYEDILNYLQEEWSAKEIEPLLTEQIIYFPSFRNNLIYLKLRPIKKFAERLWENTISCISS